MMGIKKEVIMKRLVTLFTVLLILGFCSVAGGENKGLSQPYTVTAGEWLAYRLSELVRVHSDRLSAPALFNYDRKKEVILVEMFGARESVEGAKEDLLKWCDFIQKIYLPYAKKNYGIDLCMSDYIVVYYNREASGWPEMIRMEGGKLLLSQN